MILGGKKIKVQARLCNNGKYRIMSGFLWWPKKINGVRHWLKRAYKRNLLKENDIEEIKNILDKLLPKLSAYIKYLEQKIKRRNDLK